MPRHPESCPREIWKFFCYSGGAFGERGNDWPPDHAGRIQYSQCIKNLGGATLLVSPKMNERKCLQRIKREAAGPVGNDGLHRPIAPIGAPASLARRHSEAFLSGSARLIEVPVISMNLIETEIDGELFRRGRQRLAKQPVSQRMVVAIGGDPLLKQRVDLVRGNCSPPGGYVDCTRDAPARVRRIASRAPMERRRAVSMTDRMSA